MNELRVAVVNREFVFSLICGVSFPRRPAAIRLRRLGLPDASLGPWETVA